MNSKQFVFTENTARGGDCKIEKINGSLKNFLGALADAPETCGDKRESSCSFG
jgi:hypothetical protein